MKLLSTACLATLLTCISAAMWTSAAMAQQPKARTIPPAPTTTVHPQPTAPHFTPPSLSAPQVTPELWVYSQELQRHDDPSQAVRRKAEAKADQRLARLAALKWYGQSNSRPDANPIPLMSSYSPSWIGNGGRYDWAAFGISASLLRVETIDIVR
jgi:hypothetical protein